LTSTDDQVTQRGLAINAMTGVGTGYAFLEALERYTSATELIDLER